VNTLGTVATLENGERRRRRSSKPFGRALRELLEEANITTPIGNPDWSSFAKRIGTNYESLRKAVAGERQPPRQLMESVAEELAVDARYFAEYRLLVARDLFDVGKVGFDSALEHLSRWANDELEP
jgi:transcriptional regulator with XRE-family HTH domain